MKTAFFATALALIASDAAAQDRMSQSYCQNAYERAAKLVSPTDPVVALQIQYARVTIDGWCQFRGQDPGFEHAPFRTFEWRMSDTAAWISNGTPPRVVQVRIAGFEPDDLRSSAAPPLNVEATLRQDPDAGLLILERAVIGNDAGDSLSVSGVFERVFLTSPSMIQVSMGSATFKAGLVSMTLDGTHENPFGFHAEIDVQGTSQSQADAMFDAISRLPDGLVDDASRAELTAFASDLPKPVGNLVVSVSSERGLGLAQVGLALYNRFASAFDESGASNEFDVLFDGVTMSANWTPAAQVAD